MEMHVRVGTIWGIPIGLHTSWFLIFVLLTWSLAGGYFPQEYPQLNGVLHWILALATSLLFFGSVLAHELGHAFVALRNRVPVNSITLFLFGGVAQVAQEPRTPGAEFRIAIAGPVVSLGLAGLFAGLWLLDSRIPILAAPSVYLLRINLMLALFNMIPGFPLDGGRVLRSIVWKLTGSFSRASRVASFSGQVVAFGFIGYGIYTLLNGNFFNGLWLIFIGWFLQNAAASAYAQTNLQQSLDGVRVQQVMLRDWSRVPALTPLDRLVEDQVLSGGRRYFFVGDEDRLQGLLTLRDITKVPQRKWPFTPAAEAMIPLDRLVQVQPEHELLSALRTMDDADVAQVPVVDQGRLVGVLSRNDVMHYLRTRVELGI